MTRKDPATPHDYLASLPDNRRELVDAVRSTILEHLPEGFEEALAYGMISYVVPLEQFPTTYNGQPLSVIALANQKNYVSTYLMGIYADDNERDWFIDAWKTTGKKLNMGKSCVRFKKLDDIAFDVLGEAVSRVQPSDLIAAHQTIHGD